MLRLGLGVLAAILLIGLAATFLFDGSKAVNAWRRQRRSRRARPQKQEKVSTPWQWFCRNLLGDSRPRHLRKTDALSLRVQQWGTGLVFALGLVVCALCVWDHTRVDGERVVWDQGTSIWPPLLIRSLGIMISFVLLLRCWWLLESNWHAVLKRFHLDEGHHARLTESLENRVNTQRWYHLLVTPILDGSWNRRVFEFSRAELTDLQCGPQPWSWWARRTHRSINALELLKSYRREDGRSFTIVRCLGRFVVYGLAALIVWLLLNESVEPFRGAVSYWTNQILNFLGVISYGLLVIYVAYTTQLLTRLITLLTGKPTDWPSAAKEHVSRIQGDAGMDNVDEFLDIKFIAARSQAVASMIYYPFISLVFIIVSRSSYFDRWQVTWSGVLLFSIHALYAVGCVCLLRRAAEKARGEALNQLHQKLLIAEATAPNKSPIPQLKSIIEYVKNADKGAFASFTRQPVLTAMLLPAGTSGFMELLKWL
jgi:hypothetical protein